MQLLTLHKNNVVQNRDCCDGRAEPENGKRLKGVYRVILLIVNNRFISKNLNVFEKVMLHNI